jgi:hypothetical protein
VTERLPDEIERFLADHIESVESINVLLLLFALPERHWTVDQVSRESRSNGWSAEIQLQALSDHGLLRFLPGPPATYQAETAHAGIVAHLARTFLERRVAVIRFIYSR